jgi:hypothetical protein
MLVNWAPSGPPTPSTIAMAVNYHVTDASAVYAQFGSLSNMKSRVINSRAYEQVKNVFGQFDAADAIQKRALLKLWYSGCRLSEILNRIGVSDTTVAKVVREFEYLVEKEAA